MPLKSKQAAARKTRHTTEPKTGVTTILKQLEALARTVEALQQELRETHFTMEVRLENLELRVAEVQAELTRKKTGGVPARSSSHH